MRSFGFAQDDMLLIISIQPCHAERSEVSLRIHLRNLTPDSKNTQSIKPAVLLVAAKTALFSMT
jgi:hypothetical protein